MNARIVVGVGGGIAAYKSCELVRRLREAGHSVRVIPTDAALNFVGAATWEALSGQPVSTTVFDDVHSVAHVEIGQHADLVVVAPATANLIAKAATGQATDLLGATLLMTSAPVIFAPAMHTEMWQHQATQSNIATLRERGNLVLDPASGRLTGADTGSGRLPEPAAIAESCFAVLAQPNWEQDLAGVRILVSAGGTREPIDPVRFLGNRSSGKQGWAFAVAAVSRGARVEVIAANVDAPDPAGTTVERVGTAEQMHVAVQARAKDFDVVVMAAAVADFRVKEFADRKIKKVEGEAPASITLTKTTDVLAELATSRTGTSPFLVGFAAETVADDAELISIASVKRERKGADLIVANAVGIDKAFEADENQVSVIDASGVILQTPATTKIQVAQAVLDVVSERVPHVAVH